MNKKIEKIIKEYDEKQNEKAKKILDFFYGLQSENIEVKIETNRNRQAYIMFCIVIEHDNVVLWEGAFSTSTVFNSDVRNDIIKTIVERLERRKDHFCL